MRKVKEITAEEENSRVVPLIPSSMFNVVKRDFIEPEPVGTIVIMASRITGYS